MISKRRFIKFALLGSLIVLAAFQLVGCRYTANRANDFADIFQMGVGVTAENPVTGMFPPSLGLHAQVTEFLNLGAIHFTGLVAEWDGRGFFAGPETRTRLGFLPLQTIQLGQDYARGYENCFKKPDTLWADRMHSEGLKFAGTPAKALDYEFWSRMRSGSPIFYRGWQYWGTVSVEAAISEPFFTHLGLHLRLGVDVSEISDWILGFFTLDFKSDDLTRQEFEEMCDRLLGPLFSQSGK